MKKWIQEYGYIIYLVLALAVFADLDMENWQAWVILMPTIFLATLRR